MSVDLKPETERLVKEELQNGHFASVDEMIAEGVRAWREKHGTAPPEHKQNLVDFFRESPLVGLELDLERDPDTGQDIDL